MKKEIEKKKKLGYILLKNFQISLFLNKLLYLLYFYNRILISYKGFISTYFFYRLSRRNSLNYVHTDGSTMSYYT